MIWFWLGVGLMMSPAAMIFIAATVLHFYLRWKYMETLLRIFQEKPLFIIPHGKPIPDAEDVRIPTADGLELAGCYLKTSHPVRRGVIWFGLEFGSKRWSCAAYCEKLLEAGYDVFAYEPRNQGDSDVDASYDPIQWLTAKDLLDAEAALRYLKSRPDADSRGVGFFGISKGGNAGLYAGAADPWVRGFVTDGVFSSYLVMVPYMRKWFSIYNPNRPLHGLVPSWYFGLIARVALRKVSERRGVPFLDLEKVLHRIAPRPLLMIHGGADTYIKPEMARELWGYAREPKDYWEVPGAKHNLALSVAGNAYHERVVGFFDELFAPAEPVPADAV